MFHRSLEPLASVLLRIQAVKFGCFVIDPDDDREHRASAPIRFDLRTELCMPPGPLRTPDVRMLASGIHSVFKHKGIQYEGVCVLAKMGTALANGMKTFLHGDLQVVELAKSQSGGQRRVDGITSKSGLHRGDRVVLLLDFVQDVDTLLKTIHTLRAGGFLVEDLVAVFDLQDITTAQKIAAEGVRLHSIFLVTDLLDYYVEKNWIDAVKHLEVLWFLGIACS